VSDGEVLHGLADYQLEAVTALQSTISRVADHIDTRPDHRREIALKSGAMLLQAPTGSGKTLILGRTIEGLIGALPMKTVWFWFAPYAGLVVQTRDALSEQCPGIRLRELATDRAVGGLRDGDVFVQTWAAVAANNKDARKVRRTREDGLSLDDMLVLLRESGVAIGVVIDEAHLNFGASAGAAAKFYLDALQPDFTLLATATPNDEKLEAFERAAGVEVESRVVVARDRVVEAGLNKRGLMLGYLRMNPGDEAFIDFEQATLTAGWTQHRQICERLSDKGIGLTPLMLVQVEDQASGGEDPVKRVREKLLEINGIRDEMIAVHTSGEPDADFHMLAYDDSKQILIFKVAVATGFDAPRAWTLVSVRPNRGAAFGLQIVGRIMRVHPLLRSGHGSDDLLDRGYVFLTDPDMQAGLSAAVDELKAVRQSLTVLSDQLDIVEYGASASANLLSDVHRASAYIPQPPSNAEERQERLALLIYEGIIGADVAAMDSAAIDHAIVAGETARVASQTPLFGNLPQQDAPAIPLAPKVSKLTPYPLRLELGVPEALWQERPLGYAELNDPAFIDEIAAEFCNRSSLLAQIHQTRRAASMSLRDLFLADEEREISLSLRVSNARIAEKAQQAFQLNDSVDPRLLERALIEALRVRAFEQGIEFSDQDLRRTIQMAAMREPDALLLALKQAQGKRVHVDANEPIPNPLFDVEGADPAAKAAHGIFPGGMNKPERAFAEFLDTDQSGAVSWWLRNPENVTWATRMILPTGQRFFPDFAVGIKGRSTRDSVALVEIKDDGVDGRLHSDKNVLKIQVQHREYRNVFWTYSGDQGFERLTYNESLNRIGPIEPFMVSKMVLLSA
jgi:type III restriction enzyme